jgi:hypothetical protein
MYKSNIVIEAFPGDDITSVAKTAQGIASEKGGIVEFNFNGINVLINSASNLENMFRTYQDAFTMDWKEIGPDYVDVYPQEIQVELTAKKEAYQKKMAEQQKAYEEEMNRLSTIIENKISGIVFAAKNADDFETFKTKNNDGYGAGIITYAERWARLIQYEMNNGKTLEEVADATSHEANKGIDITGFMYGMAVNVLSSFWEFGEQLRVWHNKSYGHEGDGVVNPAVMTLNV